MKIKRYAAASMRDALALIRSEQGPEAVILSSRRLDEGVEVVSAVDYDAELIGAASRPQRAAPAAAHAASPAASPAELAAPDERQRDAVSAPSGVERIEAELKDMRSLLETELAVLGWRDRRRRTPVSSAVLAKLSALDIAPDVASSLTEKLPRKTTAVNPDHLPFALMMKYLPIGDAETLMQGGVVALVGPTGVGKTTTIAKIAAQWCMRTGGDDIALVSTDGYRVGAREQLLTYARILGVPMHAANGAAELAKLLQRLTDKRLVLIDTAGLSQRDPRVVSELGALRSVLEHGSIALTLSAAAESKSLDETVRSYACARPDACILTKIDEAASLGGALSAVLRHELPVAYLCDGQRVPEDLHIAADKRIWLIRTAAAMHAQAPTAVDEVYLARHFPRVQSHA